MSDEVRINDIGTVFRVTFKDHNTITGQDDTVDISSASTKQLIFKKSNGNLLTVAGTFYTNGTDGILQYTTVSGDIDQVGLWRLQGYVVIGTSALKSSIYTFRCNCNL